MNGPHTRSGPLVFDGSCLGGARPTGVERAFLRTLDAFERKRPEVDITLFVPPDLHPSISHRDDTSDELRIATRIRIEETSRRVPLALWRQMLLPKRLRELNARALWTPTTALPAMLPCPAIATVHEIPTLELEDSRIRGLRQRRARRVLHGRAARIIVPSTFTQRALTRESGALADRIRVIPQPLGPEFLRLAKPGATQPKGTPGRGLVFVGLERKRKNLPRIARAWQLASQRLRAASTFTWIGCAPGRRAYFEGFGIHCLDAQPSDALVASIQASRAVILASCSEGFGLPAIEALACGRIPVLARDSAPAELCGDLAATCDPLDTDSIATAIARALEDDALAERVQREGPTRAAMFTAAASANAWSEVLAELELR